MGRPSVSRLLVTPATLLHRDDGAVDEYGNPEPGWVDVGATTVLLQQRYAKQDDNGSTQVSVWTMFLPPEVPMDGWDRIRVGGEDWTLDGDAAPGQAAIDGMMHHNQVRVRRVR